MWEIVNKESSSTSSYTANNNRVCAVIIKIQLKDVSGAAPPELVTWLYFSKKLVAGGAGGAVTNFSFSVSPRWRLYMNINYKRRCTINSSKLTYILIGFDFKLICAVHIIKVLFKWSIWSDYNEYYYIVQAMDQGRNDEWYKWLIRNLSIGMCNFSKCRKMQGINQLNIHDIIYII